MKKDNKRKNIRLKDYDYSQEGMYFITICTENRIEILGKIKNESCIKLTKQGTIVRDYIKKIEEIYKNTIIDEYVVMPNHILMNIQITKNNKVPISRIIKQYKMYVSKKVGYSIQQKLFYEHIIRNEKEYYKIKNYIQNNVVNWKKDKYF